ncbi:MAG: glycoside hydrolase family 127 protein, partial [Kiritimatiellae bacterium]|nr:glycoside hydrolase family 127 protein [Kiritimatiellia bacterium]
AKSQEAMPSKGYNNGFLSAYPESFFDRVDACKPVWAPYYTLHKILAGLLDSYIYCDNKQALDILEKMVAWLKPRIERLGHGQQQKVLGNEHGGMNETLANLYAITGNPDHLKLAKEFNHEVIFNPLAKGEDQLNGKHANTQIPKITGAAREYELTGETNFKDIASNFWKFVAIDRSYCIGGHSDSEHFFPVDQFSQHLNPATCETCNTYNMLKLTRHLFEWEPKAEIMDFYERALFNQILGSQDPNKGMVIYFASLKPGHFKTYSTPYDSFWCCVGTGIENHSKYGEMIFSHDDKSLFLNLFIASELNWKEKGLVVKQETQFPEQDTTRLTMKCEKPVKLALKVRYPAWVTGGMTININGKKEEISGTAGSYITVDREWKDGDQIEIKIPMQIHLEAIPGNPDIVAVLYGPIVLAGELGIEGLGKISPYVKGQLDLAKTPVPNIPILVCKAKELPGKIEPVTGKPLTFQTKGIGRPKDVSLIPYYKIHYQRLTVYWKLFSEADWKKKEAEIMAEAEKRKAFEARIIDEIKPGEQQSETDHNLKSEHSNSGDFHDRKWRDAFGWFSYEMKVLKDKPMILACTYWGDDAGKREFNILVDGEKITTQKLNHNKRGEFYEEQYVIPENLTKNKEKVTIKFQSHPGNIAGGMFGILMLKKE